MVFRSAASSTSTVPLVQNGTLECWVIPWPSKARSAIIGGDMAFTRTATARLCCLQRRPEAVKKFFHHPRVQYAA